MISKSFGNQKIHAANKKAYHAFRRAPTILFWVIFRGGGGEEGENLLGR
jgi:hypothetical protein